MAIDNKKKKIIFLLYIVFSNQVLFAQVRENMYQLNPLENLLTPEVKKIVDQNIAGKPTVFLGEAVHYSGSDFLAKTEFVKYLVREHGYKNIAFESDFFGLFFDHHKRNLFKFWSVSEQCKDLMAFLKESNVTIWGFDNQLHSYYSQSSFANKLAAFLQANAIAVDDPFMRLTVIVLKNRYESRKLLSKEDIDYLKGYVLKLLGEPHVQQDLLCTRILESYGSAIAMYTMKDDHDDENVIAIRDRQMAKNLDFLVKQNSDHKIIVWLANGHMSKRNDTEMKGKTMGAHFGELNPNSSYHIAFGSIKMPPERTRKSIDKAKKDSNSILSYLPSTCSNYFLDADTITNGFPAFKDKLFSDGWIFNLDRKKEAILSHFDALVFIAGGVEVSYGK